MSGLPFASGPAALFKALSEEMRLRLLCVLEESEFSVAELTDVLGAPQSTVSRHLARLREADLVVPRREGALVYYSPGPALSETDGFDGLLGSLGRSLPTAEADREAARRVLEERRRRSRSYFDSMARRYSDLAEPGLSWRAVAGALAFGFDGRVIADVGAGEGELTLRLARSAARVYAVDSSPRMIEAVRERTADLGNVEAVEGDLEALPLADGACDLVIVSQTLHHCARPAVGLRETRRALRPGGRLILIDLLAHEQEWTRERLADLWLGFEPDQLKTWAREAGYCDIETAAEATAHEGLSSVILTGKRDAKQ